MDLIEKCPAPPIYRDTDIIIIIIIIVVVVINRTGSILKIKIKKRNIQRMAMT